MTMLGFELLFCVYTHDDVVDSVFFFIVFCGGINCQGLQIHVEVTVDLGMGRQGNEDEEDALVKTAPSDKQQHASPLLYHRTGEFV